jgi:hypothetical protein
VTSEKNILYRPVPGPLAVAIIGGLIVCLFFWPAFKARNAAKQAKEAKARYEQGLKRVSVIVEKFNKETGNNVETVQEVTVLMRDEGWYLHKASNSWKKRADDTTGSMLRQKKNKEFASLSGLLGRRFFCFH